MSARDDYPYLAESARNWGTTRLNEPAGALGEIDRLRIEATTAAAVIATLTKLVERAVDA